MSFIFNIARRIFGIKDESESESEDSDCESEDEGYHSGDLARLIDIECLKYKTLLPTELKKLLTELKKFRYLKELGDKVQSLRDELIDSDKFNELYYYSYQYYRGNHVRSVIYLVEKIHDFRNYNSGSLEKGRRLLERVEELRSELAFLSDD